MIAREAFIQALPFAWLFHRNRTSTPAATRRPTSEVDPAPYLHAALAATVALYGDAEQRQDTQAMRAYDHTSLPHIGWAYRPGRERDDIDEARLRALIEAMRERATNSQVTCGHCGGYPALCNCP